MSVEQFVGIDVSLDQLDVAVTPDGAEFAFRNDRKGCWELVDRLSDTSPALVLMEATGGLEAPVAGILAEAGIKVVIINPRLVRDFAKATGHLAKTDKIDAHVLAEYAQKIRPTPRPLRDGENQRLSALLRRRSQLMNMVVAEKNRLSRAHTEVKPRLHAHIQWLREELADLDKDLQKEIRSSPIWQ